ncbi:MAG: hypothetical protein HUJ58_05445, partial [Erysipelotrichaceae bacterium]|nr:hypothetical protein [Erysipelotrichaceae bacterium]
MNYEDLEFIEERIGYEFANRDLLRQAFVRRSYSKENGGANNEVLEFIGDKVLDLVVVKLLAKEYGYMMSSLDVYDEEIHYDAFLSEYQENKLTEIKTNLTQKKTLAKCIDNLGIAGYLIMSKGDELNEVQKEASVKEDLFEAILGAVAIDSKWNMEEIEDTVHYMLQPE